MLGWLSGSANNCLKTTKPFQRSKYLKITKEFNMFKARLGYKKGKINVDSYD